MYVRAYTYRHEYTKGHMCFVPHDPVVRTDTHNRLEFANNVTVFPLTQVVASSCE